MISIALVLLLMLGINQVFKVTGEAVGTNSAISTGVRDSRAAQNAFGRDIAAWAPDSPAIIIRSERVSAFRNALRRHARQLSGSGLVVSLTGPWPPYNFVDPPRTRRATSKTRR